MLPTSGRVLVDEDEDTPASAPMATSPNGSGQAPGIRAA